MCAYRTDGKTRAFDATPNGPGQLVGRGTELRPPESLGPSPGACLFPPPLRLSSPPSSDQYWLLITEDSMLVLSLSYLFFHFQKPPLFHSCANCSEGVCVDLFTPLHVSQAAFFRRFPTHSARMRQQAYTRLLKCVQQDKTISLEKQHLINPEHNNALSHFSGFIPVI